MPGLEGKLLGRYELRKQIGSGGMAEVYEGYDPASQRIVAVKVFKKEDEQMLRRFIREADLMRSLSNEHLVPIFDSGSCQIDGISWYYIVMPFMQGGTLQARIHLASLSLQEACEALEEIADALDYMHGRDIIHRDIKASNVLLDNNGHCLLADFGIARASTDNTQLTNTGIVLGTVNYIAPELFDPDHHKANASSDLYSLGVLLFVMVTGRLPFSAENQIVLLNMHLTASPPLPSSIVPHIPPAVDEVIVRALAKKPEQRYATATALAEAFHRAVLSDEITKPNDAQQTAHSLLSMNVEQKNQPVSASARQLQPTQPAQVLPVVLASTAGIQSQPGMQTVGLSAQVSLSSAQNLPLPSVKPAQRTKRYILFTAITVLAVLLLIVVSVIGVAVYGSISPNVDATATARAGATVAAIAAVTATAKAHATATAGVVATATSGTPTYTDPLNDASNTKTVAVGWDGVDGKDSQCLFQQDGYHVVQTATSNLHACQEPTYSYGDATISMSLTILSGHSGGIFLRFSKGFLGTYNGYMFEIDSGGDYKLSSFAGKTLQDWTPSPYLRVGYNVANKLAVIMSGNTFALYANGSYLTTLTDSSSQFASGNIALFASATDAATEVVFSNLNVYPLPPNSLHLTTNAII